MDFDRWKQKRILVVDDEPGLLQMVVSILNQDGYTQIKTAGTMREALGVCQEWTPELAILDVMLPDGDGFFLFEQIKSFLDIPILFLTARGEDSDRLHGLGLGADDYLVKPFLPKELLLRIGIILRRFYKDEKTVVTLKGSQIDFSRAEVIRGGERIPLTVRGLGYKLTLADKE